MAISPRETEMKGAYYDLVEHLVQRQLAQPAAPRFSGDSVQQQLQALCAELDLATNAILAQTYCERKGLPFRETLEVDVALRIAKEKHIER